MPEPTPEAWAQIRYDYEHTARPVVEICLEHGFTANTLRHRARKWGWRMRRAPIAAEGPPAFVPLIETPEIGDPEHEQLAAPLWLPPPQPSPASGGGSANIESGSPDTEPSPHIAPVSVATVPIGPRLQGAVARVLPAIEATLARLAAGPVHPREMELAARALGSLMRTLRELNGLLGQHIADEPRRSTEELRASVARKLAAMIAETDEKTPQRYLAGWEEFAAQAQQDAAPVL